MIDAKRYVIEEGKKNYNRLSQELERKKAHYDKQLALLNDLIDKKAEAFPSVAAAITELKALLRDHIDPPARNYFHYSDPRWEKMVSENQKLTQEIIIANCQLKYIFKLFPALCSSLGKDYDQLRSRPEIADSILSTPELRDKAEKTIQEYEYRRQDLIDRYNVRMQRFDTETKEKAAELAQPVIEEYDTKILQLEKTKQDYERQELERQKGFQLKMQNIDIEVQKKAEILSRPYIEAYKQKISKLGSLFSVVDIFENPLNDLVALRDAMDENSALRLRNVLNEKPFITKISVVARIKSISREKFYNVTLNSCECEDFNFRQKGKPCKHILFLAYYLGMLQINQKSYKNILDHYLNVSDKHQNLLHLNSILQKEIENRKNKKILLNAEIEEYEQRAKDSKELIAMKFEAYPYLAGLMADYCTVHYLQSAKELKNKKNPALQEAKRIKELQKETKQIIKDKKELEYKLAYIEKLFPNINDIFDPAFNEQSDFELETEENTDRVRLFITPEEYSSLSVTEKNQLALERYLNGPKSNWQIGRDYEMYIGHLLEDRGFFVEYTGIIEKLEDMGRDLIATQGASTYVVQCKNWSSEKTIHEKHVFQLYGTVVLYKLDNPFFNVKGVFVTTSKLSEKAKQVAKELDITVVEELPLGAFPRIKCNINRTTGERIYHLPFDQQYDRAVISAKDGECYAHTVEEAETKGFRRAWKHVVTT